ncbi:hypothetical protein NLI96_g13202 [Meripilus lineatus]|nr:hypothetical protein NLI96_g13202 [Physisporinus lineatus]
MYRVPYQNAVGALNHAAVMTRPDIAFAVHRVAQYSSNPGPAHWEAVKRIFRYLKGTSDFQLTLGGQNVSSPPVISAYCDADFANNPDHARSVSGYALTIGRGCFSWSAKKQTATALSTGEAEYYAATHVGREILWVRELLKEIHFSPESPIPLHIDNASTIRIIENVDEVTARTKHIKIALHWLRESVAERSISLHKVHTDVNVSDIFTKALPGERFRALSSLLGMGPSK